MKALVTVLAVLATAGVAVAGTDPRAEQERLTAADNARARTAVVKATDFVSGWRRLRPSTEEDSPVRCANYNPDFSRFTITGKAESRFEHTASGAEITSAVEVYRTRSEAVADFRLGARPEFASCFAQLLAAEFRKQNVQATIVSSRMVTAPRVGERAAAYRVLVRIPASGTPRLMYVDMLFFQRGRSIGALLFTSVAQPISRRPELARMMAARMR